MNPMLFSNSTIRYINYETGQMFLNEDIEFERFQDLRFSYAFRFNSVQFLLFCWDIHSPKIDQNNIVIEYQYPYYRMRDKDGIAKIPVCTDEMNYHHFEMIHVCWDELFEAGTMRRLASGDNYKYKEAIDKLWLLEEQKLREEHPRG